jgi:hypothetical protein
MNGKEELLRALAKTGACSADIAVDLQRLVQCLEARERCEAQIEDVTIRLSMRFYDIGVRPPVSHRLIENVADDVKAYMEATNYREDEKLYADRDAMIAVVEQERAKAAEVQS